MFDHFDFSRNCGWIRIAVCRWTHAWTFPSATSSIPKRTLVHLVKEFRSMFKVTKSQSKQSDASSEEQPPLNVELVILWKWITHINKKRVNAQGNCHTGRPSWIFVFENDSPRKIIGIRSVQKWIGNQSRRSAMPSFIILTELPSKKLLLRIHDEQVVYDKNKRRHQNQPRNAK